MKNLFTCFILWLIQKKNTVRKSTVKSFLKEEKHLADKIYDKLQERELIQKTSKGRFCITEKGRQELFANLVTTDYRFDSNKGPKVLNTLISFFQDIAHPDSQSLSFNEMSFEDFQNKFKKLYFEERKKQELRGVVAIHAQDICMKFANQYPISEKKLSQYFDELKSRGDIFAVEEKGNEMIQWVE